jgi:putative lipoic acid-binding regulatory protein
VELRASKTEKYLGITLIVRATSRAQLDGLYLALTGHPMVKVAL